MPKWLFQCYTLHKTAFTHLQTIKSRDVRNFFERDQPFWCSRHAVLNILKGSSQIEIYISTELRWRTQHSSVVEDFTPKICHYKPRKLMFKKDIKM